MNDVDHLVLLTGNVDMMQSKLVIMIKNLCMNNIGYGRPLPMLVLLLPFLYLAFSKPFEEPSQTIFEVAYLAVLLAITVLYATRNTDEVEVAAARFSTAMGAYVGIGCTVGLVLIVARVPAVAGWVDSLAQSLQSALPPAATGFGLGAMAAVLLILVSAVIAYVSRYGRSPR